MPASLPLAASWRRMAGAGNGPGSVLWTCPARRVILRVTGRMHAIALAVTTALLGAGIPSATGAAPATTGDPPNAAAGAEVERAAAETPKLRLLETPDGRRMLVDPTVLEYLQSSAPLPTQASLDALLARITRVRVVAAGMSEGRAMQGPVLLDTSAPEQLAALRRYLVIAEDPRGFGHDMCLGSETFELYEGTSLRASIGLHHGRVIRWSEWKHDAPLADPQGLLRWLASLGADGPQKAVAQANAVGARESALWEDWLRAMPASLGPFRPTMEEFRRQGYARLDTRAMLDALRTQYSDPGERSRALFAWFAVGSGLWSGFPSYEAVVEELLLASDTRELVAALEGRTLTGGEAEGAARYFASWRFRKQKPGEAKLLSPTLRKRFLEVGSGTTSADRLARARTAFGEP